MPRKKQKFKPSTLTLRLDTPGKVAIVHNLKIYLDEKASSRAVMLAASKYSELHQERDKLQQDLQQLRYEHQELRSHIEEGVNSLAQMMELAGVKLSTLFKR